VDGGKTWVRDTTNVFAYDNPEMLTYDQNNLYTLDAGKTWVKDPSILLGPGGFNKDRDGKVIFYEPTQDWIMIWHLSQNNNREKTAFGLYRSKDFKKWELFQTIPGLWECPDMFEMSVVDKDGRATGKKYWVISRGGVEYFIGTFDGKAFIPMTANDPGNPYEFIRFEDSAYDKKRSLRRVTFKSGCYAAQTFANAPDERHIQVSWLSSDKNGVANPGGPWENMLSFPVELTLRDTGRGLVLEHVPVREIEKIHARTHRFENVVLKEGLTRQIVSPQSNLMDIDIIFDAANAQVFGLEILGQKIRYHTREKKLCAFRTYNEQKKQYVDDYTIVQLADGKIHLRILVDKSSIEVGINNGVYRTTMLVYPQDDSVRLSFISEGGQAKIEKLTIHEIECEQPLPEHPDGVDVDQLSY
jgi:fructan beta-fructosidase